jgi:hypothetical protein
MCEIESFKIEVEAEITERPPWLNLFSAPWLFTYGFVVVQLATVPFGWARGPILLVYVFLAANLSLAAIVPIWSVVIRRFEFLVLAIGVLLANGVLLASITRGDLMLFLLPMLVGGTVAIPLVVISLFWGRFDKPSADVEMRQFQEGLKFGILHLFIASTVVAVICGIGKALAPYVVFSSGTPVQDFAVITIIVAFNTLMSVWALMGRSIVSRLIISFLLAVFSCGGGSWLFFPHAGSPMVLFMFGLCWAATTVHLALLRRSGMRFIKKQPNPQLARSLQEQTTLK